MHWYIRKRLDRQLNLLWRPRERVIPIGWPLLSSMLEGHVNITAEYFCNSLPPVQCCTLRACIALLRHAQSIHLPLSRNALSIVHQRRPDDDRRRSMVINPLHCGLRNQREVVMGASGAHTYNLYLQVSDMLQNDNFRWVMHWVIST